MPQPSSTTMPSPTVASRGRGGDAGREPVRPIAGALPLGPAHVGKIDESHARCATLGLSRIERPDFSPLGRADLNVVRERNRRLHVHAAPVMEMLFEQIVNSDSMVVLTDAMGTVLHAIGDDEFLGRASKVALSPGANWSEQAKGTNAVGTALIEETPTLVHADEHYMHANHFLTCSAAPILDPRGNILGVLDVSGDHRSYHQHTMGLVKMSARMIENHWLTEDYRNVLRLHFHSRVEFIGTLMEGILAISEDGRIVGANRGALEQLGLSGVALRMHTLESLFGTSVGVLVDRFRSPLALPLPVELQGGRQFHIFARFSSAVWHGAGSALTADATAGPAAARTGEAQVQAAAATLPSALERGPLEVRSGAASGAASPRGDAAPEGEAEGGAADGVVGARRNGLRSLATGDAQIGQLIEKIRKVLNRDIPILVLGETGTGKELLARAIHQDSARSRQPFVAVNCASIPDTLIEAELFGYEEGAFTGARRKGSVGKIVQANGGTLFLDEIGDMPIALQAHLLRVLQERQVTPLGSTKSVAVDVSIICATHRNLREMIAAKSFREDLYYRLNGLAVRLPPLRERSDLMPLVARILERECPDRRLQLSAEAVELFRGYHWPGNVRQLFNVLRTACVMAAGERVITRDHLSDDFIEDARRVAAAAAAAAATAASPAVPGYAVGAAAAPAHGVGAGTMPAAQAQGPATYPGANMPMAQAAPAWAGSAPAGESQGMAGFAPGPVGGHRHAADRAAQAAQTAQAAHAAQAAQAAGLPPPYGFSMGQAPAAAGASAAGAAPAWGAPPAWSQALGAEQGWREPGAGSGHPGATGPSATGASPGGLERGPLGGQPLRGASDAWAGGAASASGGGWAVNAAGQTAAAAALGGSASGAGQGYPAGFGLPAAPAQAAGAAPRSLEDIELASIRQAVEQAGGNISMAAKALGISRNTIYRKLRWNTPR